MIYVSWYFIAIALGISGAIAYVIAHAARTFAAEVRLSRTRAHVARLGTPRRRTKEREGYWARSQRWFARRIYSNNARARTFAVVGLIITLISMAYILHAVITFQPNVAASDPVPDMSRSVIHSDYLPDGDAFFGFDSTNANAPVPASVPNHHWGWIIFWLAWWFLVLPVMWFFILMYGFFSLREESWETLQGWVTSLRVGLSNLHEGGKSTGRTSSNDGTSKMQWPEPAIATATGTAAVAPAKNGLETVVNFLHKYAGELSGLVFLAGEWLEGRNKKKKGIEE